jgi:hypothetical protein
MTFKWKIYENWSLDRKFSCVTVVCEYFASYQDYPNYKWDLIR